MEHLSALSLHSWLKTERVLCSRCEQAFTKKIDDTPWQVTSDGNGLCAVANCLQLAIRRHLCFDHVLHHEMWEQQQPECDEETLLVSDHSVEPLELKRCADCYRNPLDIYKSGDRVVYLVISHDIQVPDLHHSHTSDDDSQSGKSNSRAMSPSVQSTHSKSKKRGRKKPVFSSIKKWQKKKKTKTHTALALDSNACMRDKKSHMYLWRNCDQHANSDDERQFVPSHHNTRTMSDQFPQPSIDTYMKSQMDSGKFEYLEPASVLCTSAGCGRFAKTGDRCRFHSKLPLETFLLHTTPMSEISARG
uniref:AlNc14C168G7952 protein n=1 Tax=Albugo laibachii Nc14 TaxID=890382 RepID=F0WNC1_9STRA|nr:AlNc14C168G7952 [Albugo laibachii Nc14]|eukprot:CCA22811.1 AlNc14C168G7952 [Albugo laibachii Nc14]